MRHTVPVRSAVVGAALAVLILTTTVTFSASLDSLVSHPALYGWNWDYGRLTGLNGSGHPPTSGRPRSSTTTGQVAAWSGVDFNSVELDGQTVPAHWT